MLSMSGEPNDPNVEPDKPKTMLTTDIIASECLRLLSEKMVKYQSTSLTRNFFKHCSICKSLFMNKNDYNNHLITCVTDTENRRLRWNEFCEKFRSLQDEYNVSLNYIYCEAIEHTIDDYDIPDDEGWTQC